MRSILLVAVAVAAFALARPAAAEEHATDAEVARLLEAKDTVRWTQVWAGQRYGHAETLVRAPFEVVKKEIADAEHFHDLGDRLVGSRVVAKARDHADLYVRLPAIGASKAPWEIFRFGALDATTPGYAVTQARAVAGNTREGHFVVSARRIDERHTLVKVDVLVRPNLVPSRDVLDEELRRFAGDVASGLRFRLQGNGEPVTSLHPELVATR